MSENIRKLFKSHLKPTFYNRKKSITELLANFDSNNFQLYMRVGTHLWYADLKGQPSRSTVCREIYCQIAPIDYCTLLRKRIKNTISMNIDPSKRPLYMDIDMNRYYEHSRYRHSWIIVHLVSLNSKLVACHYLYLLSSVSSPVLAE